jgi:hypothetical protein
MQSDEAAYCNECEQPIRLRFGSTLACKCAKANARDLHTEKIELPEAWPFEVIEWLEEFYKEYI